MARDGRPVPVQGSSRWSPLSEVWDWAEGGRRSPGCRDPWPLRAHAGWDRLSPAYLGRDSALLPSPQSGGQTQLGRLRARVAAAHRAVARDWVFIVQSRGVARGKVHAYCWSAGRCSTRARCGSVPLPAPGRRESLARVDRHEHVRVDAREVVVLRIVCRCMRASRRAVGVLLRAVGLRRAGGHVRRRALGIPAGDGLEELVGTPVMAARNTRSGVRGPSRGCRGRRRAVGRLAAKIGLVQSVVADVVATRVLAVVVGHLERAEAVDVPRDGEARIDAEALLVVDAAGVQRSWVAV